jgi:hypothetical protein
MMGRGMRVRNMARNPRLRDMEARRMKAPDMTARFTKVRDTRDHNTEARIMTVLLVVVQHGIQTLCQMRAPSRLLAVTVLPTFLLLRRRQDPNCRGQQQLNIVCRTLPSHHTTTHLQSNRNRPREHLRKFLRSACQCQPRAHLPMSPLLSLRLRSRHLDVALKQQLPLRTCLEGLRTPLALRQVYHFPDPLLLDAPMKFSKTMVLEIPRLSYQTIASVASI